MSRSSQASEAVRLALSFAGRLGQLKSMQPFDFNEFDEERRFRNAWESVHIERPVHYTLFTFGESELPYYLVCAAREPGGSVSLTQGEVRVTRPQIITPDSAQPEFHNFFEDSEEAGLVDFLISRTAAFKHLKFDNAKRHSRVVTDSVEEAVEKLNRQLDREEEDRVAILSAPANLGGIAILKYAAERVVASGPENVQELRERGFLP